MTQLDEIQESLVRIETKLETFPTPDPEPEPETPVTFPAPYEFKAVLNSDRSITASWLPPAGAESIEVHEFEVDPAVTLKATLPVGTNFRKSGTLTGGKNYSYAVRAVKGSEFSPFTQRVTIYVPASGETSTPTTPPAPPANPPASGTNPSDILDLTKWSIMLPTGSQGDPDNEYILGRSVANTFFVGPDAGVVCRTPANGFHSPNSKYARTELRQMVDGNWTKAAWSSSGNHSMECDLSIDARALSVRKRINGMQIHNGSDDVCQIMRHESLGLGFMHDDGKSWVSIDPNYVDGTKFNCKIVAAANRITVFYNGIKKVDVAKSGSGWYWKTGCYMQTGGASTYVEPSGAYGQVTLYKIVLVGGAT